MKTIPFIFFLLSATLTSQAQRVVNHQALYWLRYQNQIIFSPSLYWSNEVDNRRFFNPDVQNQFIFHSRLHYKKDKWDFATGLTLSWAFTQKPDAGYDQAVNEIRPVNEVSYELPLGKIFLQNRIRLDHRFFQEDATTSVWDESFYVLRIRYRAQIRIPLKQDGDVTRVSLRIADEIMLNHTKNTFDQNRIYLTSDFYLSEKITLEAGYIYIYQHQLGRHEFYDRHVLRVSILHKLRL